MNLLWQQIPSSQVTTIYCQSNFDGIVFDDEHGAFNSETLVTLIQLANYWGDRKELLQNRNPKLIAQIETRSGIELLDSIKDEFDFFMLGPYDLSADVGCVADWENAKYKNIISEFESKIPPEKRCVHIVSNIKKELENKFSDYRIKALGMDTTILKEGLNRLI